MAAQYEHVSAGRWRDTKTGKIINSTVDPNKSSSKTSSTKTSTPGGKTSKTIDPVKVAGDFTDPSKVVNAQEIENKNVADANVNLNRINESNDFGSREYVKNPDGSYTIKDSLSPGQKDLLNAQQGTGTLGASIAGTLLGGINSPYDANSLASYLPQGSDTARQDTYNATYGMLSRDFARDKEQDRQNTEQQLADRGYTVGSPQYEAEMNRFDQRWSDQELNARNQATLSGNQAFNDTFNQGQTNYTNRLGAYQSNYTLPTQISGQLQGLGQIYNPQYGQGVTSIQMPGVDYGAYYQTATQAGLDQQRINKMGSGGGGTAAPAYQYPSIGGLAGAGIVNQNSGGSIGQNIANGLTKGITAGVTNSLYK